MARTFEIAYNCGRWYVYAFEFYHGPYNSRSDAIEAGERMETMGAA